MESAGTSARSTDSKSPAVPAQMRKRYELLDECRELIINKLGDALNEAVVSMTASLAEEASKSQDSKQQELLLEAASVVRSNQHEFAVRFRKSFKDIFERRLFNKGEEKTGSPEQIDMSTLSLVSDDDVSSRLAIERLVHRSKSRLNPDDVLGMRARLGALLERDWYDEDKQPASPKDVFEALKLTLNELAPTPAVSSALLEAFEPFMSSQLSQAYTHVNQRLLAHQILPKIRPVVQRVGGAARNAAANAAASGIMEQLQQGVSQEQTDQSGQAGQTGYAGQSVGPISSDAMFMNQQAFIGMLESLQRGLPAARQQAVRLLTDEASFGLLDLPFPEVSAPLLDAVGHIQSSTIDLPLSGRRQLGQLQEQVQEKGSALDKLTVDIVELVFDYIYSDHRLADPIKQQLLRLQVIAVKAALLDRSFFAKRQHPLRQVLDTVTELGCDPDVDPSPDSALVKNIEVIVTAIVTNFTTELSVFEQALESLVSVQEQEEERRRIWLDQQTADTILEEQRIEALDEYRRTLSQRVDNHSPDFLREFLYRWWSPVLAAARVNSEAPLDEGRGLKLAEMLLWSVAPKSPEEVPRLASLLPQLITGIIKGLGMVDCPQPEREAFFNELLKIHTRAIDAAKSSPSAAATQAQLSSANPGQPVAARPVSNFVMSSTGEINFNGLSNTEGAAAMAQTVSYRDAAVDMLVRGQRLDVMEESGAVNRYKLAWISPSKKLYLLSRYPHEPLSVSRIDMTSWFESGRAQIANDDSIIGKAIGAAAMQNPKVAVAA